VSVVLPLVFVSAWLVPLVWLGWFFLLEPLNHGGGRASNASRCTWRFAVGSRLGDPDDPVL